MTTSSVACSYTTSRDATDFILYQRLAEGSELMPGFRPNLAAISDHREFLNHVLDQNGIDPFLLRLDGPMRDKAARLLGQAIVSLVPESRLPDLENGTARLSEFDGLLEHLAREMAAQVAQTKRIDFTTLFGLDKLGTSAAYPGGQGVRSLEGVE